MNIVLITILFQFDELFDSEDVARTLCKDFDVDDPKNPSFTNELT